MLSKLIIFSLVAFYMLGFIVTPTFAQTGSVATLALSPSSATFNQGCTISVDILVNTGGASTDGTDVILFYEPAMLKATAITKGTIYTDYPGNSIDEANGRITISGLASVSTAFLGSGKLATITFVVPNNASGRTQLRFDFDPSNKTKTTDSNVVERGSVSDILGSVTDGSYTVGSGACTSGSSSSSSTVLRTVPAGAEEPGSTFINNQSTPSALITKTIPPVSGLTDTTTILAVVGGILTVLGIIGLAVL